MAEIKIERLRLKESAKVRGGANKTGAPGGNSGISTDTCACCCGCLGPVPLPGQ
jgi:hypothetical protein